MIFAARNPREADAFEFKVLEWVRAFEAKYSRFREDSLITEINNQAGISPVATDAELDAIFALCDWFHDKTGGL